MAKGLTLSVLISAMALSFSGCFGTDKKEDNRQQALCTGIICLNAGYCVNGACVCTANWTGADCSQPVQVNQCAAVVCLNGGYCVNGACSCPTSYSGPNCGTQVTPRTMRINRITLRQFPSTDAGTAWDPFGGAPDIFFTISMGPTVIYTSNTVQDAQGGQSIVFSQGLPLDINSPTASHTVFFYDEDLTVNDPMGGLTFVPYSNASNFPTMLNLVAGGFDVLLEVSYAF